MSKNGIAVAIIRDYDESSGKSVSNTRHTNTTTTNTPLHAERGRLL